MKILHLYYDLMNLYGDYANINALERILNKNGIETEVVRLSIGDEINFSDYDFIFSGSGTERNQKFALGDFINRSESFKAYLENGGFCLMTGNSFEMLGRSITDSSGECFDGLGIFDFTVAEQDKTRNTADTVADFSECESPIVGFINKCSTISGIKTPLFSLKMGLSNEDGNNFEGIWDKNFYGTHITGPLLIKNPHFLKYLAEKLTQAQLNTDYMEYEYKAYDLTLENLLKRI